MVHNVEKLYFCWYHTVEQPKYKKERLQIQNSHVTKRWAFKYHTVVNLVTCLLVPWAAKNCEDIETTDQSYEQQQKDTSKW